jgi:hypothetical protein
MHRLLLSLILWVLLAAATHAEPPSYLVFVSNERSGDVTVIDGPQITSSELFQWETAARHSRYARWTRVFVTLSGSPRMAPGLMKIAPADKRADGLGVIDPSARKLIDRWHVGRTRAIRDQQRRKIRLIANEDDASASIIDLDSGQLRGRIKFRKSRKASASIQQTAKCTYLRRKGRSVRHRRRSTACDRNHRNRRSSTFGGIFT